MKTIEAWGTVARVLERVAPGSDLAQVDPDRSLREQLDLDSLDFLAYVEGLSAACGRDIPEADYPVVDTLSGAIAFATEALGHAPA
jgi:acyl carrier protein